MSCLRQRDNKKDSDAVGWTLDHNLQASAMRVYGSSSAETMNFISAFHLVLYELPP